MKHSTQTTLLGALLMVSAAALGQGDSRLESIITGNQEQPQVLYLVPWQTPDSPTLKYDVINNQAHVVFEHIERSELLRELKYLPPLAEPDLTKLVETASEQQGESQSSQPAPEN
ncbi:hypothetical protein [Gilvimarinus agarilyticus]|uniref:hypothetical protein n=1 Tax=Gilvimarinus agarilyticus TaxID=679259 RepID=UPI0006977036|nr:hypothetical protein [Gilvimarinus agarilyticus]